MNGLLQDFRSSIRILLSQPGFTGVTVLTLALGIGACTAIFTVVNGVLLHPLPYAAPERIMELREVPAWGGQSDASEANFLDWQQSSRSIEYMALYSCGQTSVSGGSEPVRASACQVSRDYFRVFGVAPSIGRTFQITDTQAGAIPVVVVSYGFWKRQLGGDLGLEGKFLKFENRSYALIGIMPPSFNFPEQSELWIPQEIQAPVNPYRTAHNWGVIARLRPGETLDQARADMTAIANRIKVQYGKDVDAVDVAVIPLRSHMVQGVRKALWVLLAAVGILLLIACANVANLLLAQAVARQKELAIRAALGASRSRLIRQFLVENFLRCLAGGVLAVVISLWGVSAMLALSAQDLPRFQEIHVDGRVLVFALAVAVFTTLILGLVSATRISDPNLSDILKEEGRSSSSGPAHHHLQSLLVVLQVAMTLVLLTGAGLLARSFGRLLRVDLGFQTDSRLVADLSFPEPRDDREALRLAADLQRLLERLRALPGVLAVGGVSNLPLSSRLPSGEMLLEGRGERTIETSTGFCVASEGYFRAMGIPLIRGRLFTDTEGPGTPHVAVISQRAAQRLWPHEDVLGKRVNSGNMDGDDHWSTIVGIVGDVHDRGPDRPAYGDLYVDYRQRPRRTNDFSLVIHSQGDPIPLVPSIRQAVRALNPELPARFRTLDGIFSSSMTGQRFNLTVLAAFGGAGLLLAALGLYGVMAYSVAQRTREIGVRMALGAEPGQVIGLFLGDGSKLILTGLIIGVLGALALGRVFSTLLFEVSARDPLTLVAVSLPLFGISLLASYVPARRATRVDPLITIQQDKPLSWRSARRTSRPRLGAAKRQTAPHPTERQVLADLAASARGTSSLEELYSNAVETVRVAMGSRHAHAFFCDDATGDFLGAVSMPKINPSGHSAGALRIKKDAFVIRRLSRLSTPLWIEAGDYEAWEQAEPPNLRERGIEERREEISALRAAQAGLVAPMRLKGETVGLLILGPREDGSGYDLKEREFVGDMATHLAFIVANSKLAGRVAEQERLVRELQMASEVQRRLLPQVSPTTEMVEIAGACTPARGVAGDYFDYVILDADHLGIVLADVAGKGMAAALLMSSIQASMRTLASRGAPPPAGVVAAINHLLVLSTGPSSYATLFYGQLDLKDLGFTFVNAGHNPPILIRAGQAGNGSALAGELGQQAGPDTSFSSASGQGAEFQVEYLSAGGPVVGMFSNLDYEQSTISLLKGDLLVAYTDGVTEASDSKGEEFGTERLIDLLLRERHLGARELVDKVKETIAQFTADAPLGDDLTLLVVKVQ